MTIMDAKRNFVIDAATKLFLERSVSSVTIKDIAKASGLGEATVYRYFSGRGELIIACAMKLSGQVEQIFIDHQNMRDGYCRIARFYEAYLKIYTESPELYRFLQGFDAYCIGEGVDSLEEYSDILDRFRDAFISAYSDGLSDGTVKETDDIETFYYSTTHALLELCKKLASERRITRWDGSVDSASEVRVLIDIILSYIKA